MISEFGFLFLDLVTKLKMTVQKYVGFCSIVGIFKITKICYVDMLVCLSKCTLYTKRKKSGKKKKRGLMLLVDSLNGFSC